MNPDLTPADFAAVTEEFFRLNNLADLQFHDGETALGFIYESDDMVELFVKSFAARNSEIPPLLIYHFASALGEAYRLIFNGSWVYKEKNERWVVEFTMPKGEIMAANVFYKVENRFLNGDEDSLVYMFESLKAMYLGQLEL